MQGETSGDTIGDAIGDNHNPTEIAGDSDALIPQPAISLLLLKELRETLRDRRTITTLLLMPLLVYPLLAIVFRTFLLGYAVTSGPLEVSIGVESEEQRRMIAPLLVLEPEVDADSKVEDHSNSGGSLGLSSLLGSQKLPEDDWQLHWFAVEDLGSLVRKGNIDVALHISETYTPETSAVQIYYRSDSVISVRLAKWAEKRLESANERLMIQRLNAAGVPSGKPLKLEAVQVGEIKPAGPVSLATMMPMILVLMTITGAVYPAIDLTAGERERGTLESLIASPVPRVQLLAAKYVAVLVVAILTAVANLIAMTITLQATGLGALLFGGGIRMDAILLVTLLLVLFAGFFSAVLLAITSLARSFREAQVYVIPLVLLALGPSLVGLMPGSQLSGPLLVTPLVNVVLLARDALLGTATIGAVFLVVLTTAVYGCASLAAAARIFGTDSVLYGSSQTWSDLLERPTQRRESAGVTTVLFTIAAGMVIFFFVASFANLFFAGNPKLSLLAGGIVTGLLFGGLPSLILWWQRLSFHFAWGKVFPSLIALVAVIILGLSTWPLVAESVVIAEKLNWISVDISKIEAADKLLEAWRQIPLPLVLVCLAVIPAIAEEWFFRGFCFSALRKHTSPLLAIVVTGFLFGAFHVMIVFTLEKMIPSVVLGMLLGWIRWRTGSVTASTITHMIHNAGLLIVGTQSETVAGWVSSSGEAEHLPTLWLILSVTGCVIGIGLLAWLSRPKSQEPVTGG